MINGEQNNMFIYRVEDEFGNGCYRNKAYWVNRIKHHDFNPKYPQPREDKGINRYVKENEFCGFKDLTQLKQWFNLKEIKRMRKNGYTIHKIEVEAITAYGQKQCLALIPKLRIKIDENMIFNLPV